MQRRYLKYFVCIFLFSLPTTYGRTQETFKTLNEAQKNVLKERIKEANHHVKNICFEFTQTKTVSMLKEKVQSRGNMIFETPAKLRWEYESPSSIVFVLSDGKASMKINGKLSEGSGGMQRNFMFLCEMMMDAVNGDLLHDTKNFSVQISGNSKIYRIEYTPLQRQLKSLFTKMLLSIDAETAYVNKISLYEKSGNISEIKFTKRQINKTLDANTFRLIQD